MKFSLAVGNWCQKIEHYMLLFLFLLSFFLFKANLVLYILQQTILVDETCVQKSEEKS